MKLIISKTFLCCDYYYYYLFCLFIFTLERYFFCCCCCFCCCREKGSGNSLWKAANNRIENLLSIMKDSHLIIVFVAQLLCTFFSVLICTHIHTALFFATTVQLWIWYMYSSWNRADSGSVSLEFKVCEIP